MGMEISLIDYRFDRSAHVTFPGLQWIFVFDSGGLKRTAEHIFEGTDMGRVLEKHRVIHLWI